MYYSGGLLNPTKLPIETVQRVHFRLSKHNFNRQFVAFYDSNKESWKNLALSEEILFVRPASLEEVLSVEPNIESLQPRNDVMCPSVIFVAGVFYIAIPPLIKGIPSFKEWTETKHTKCELCGVNVNYNNTGYCCNSHMTMTAMFQIKDLKVGVDNCSICAKVSTRECKCGKSYCSRTCQRLDKKKHIKVCKG